MLLGRDVRLLLGTSSAPEKRFLPAFSTIDAIFPANGLREPAGSDLTPTLQPKAFFPWTI
jgi:hypothetical protein